MISVNGSTIDPATLGYPEGSPEAEMLETLRRSSRTYRYDNTAHLRFELELRKSIVNAAKDLNRSGMDFRVFRKSRANPDYWLRTQEGGFQLQPGVNPRDAILDIFRNGRMYGTECATAMVIVYFKALADVLPEGLFNQLFPDIYLMNWKHLDRDLGISTVDFPADYLPGDIRYVKNPDVNPLHPEWQGENAIVLGDGLYYGHGVGITSADRIVAILNGLRREGATRSAYLLDLAQRPDFRHLSRKLEEYRARQAQPA